MNNFLGELVTFQIDAYQWKVYEDFTYRIGAPDGPEFVTIRKGFVTDFASIPRPLWWLWPPSAGKHAKPACVHDCLYKTGFVTSNLTRLERTIDRAEADRIFLEAMEVAGVSWLSRRMIYRGVRVGGMLAWNKHRNAEHDATA